MANETRPVQPEIVDSSGLALVHEGQRIVSGEESAATLIAGDANVVNYYFPVEIEIVDPGSSEVLAEMIYDALQREFNALG